MGWWGKAVGGAFGFLAGGPLGAALGAALGHQFDRGIGQLRLGGPAGTERERIQAAFFTTTFTVMGHLAKADGRVSEKEIAFAEASMATMALDAEQRSAAIRLFRDGKRSDFPLDATLDQFKAVCHRRHSLMRLFLEMQLQAAYADGSMDPRERELLLRVFRRLGFSQAEFVQLDAMVRAARGFGGRRGRTAPAKPRRDVLREAYQVLGVDPAADDAAVKRAYRRLMSQHHPDKLVAKGLPEEMVKLATEKTQEIKRAYDTIKEARGPG